MADKIYYQNNLARSKSLEILKEKQLNSLQSQIDELNGSLPAGLEQFGSVEGLKQEVFGAYEKIAPILNSNISAHIQQSNESIILNSNRSFDKRKAFEENIQKKQETYVPLFTDLARAMGMFQNKNSTGYETMLKSVAFNDVYSYGFNEKVRSGASFKDVERSINHLRNAKSVITFDIETFGGKNQFGKQDLDMITEFAFHEYDGFNENAKRGKSYVGFVGIQKESRAKYEDLISKYESDPLSLTSKDKVTLNYLAKMGSDDFKLDHKGKGAYVVSGAPDMSNLTVNAQLARKGLERSLEVGEQQLQFKGKDGLMQWQRDFASGIQMMMDKKKNAALLGHNILQADIPWMNQFIAKADPALKSHLNNLGVPQSLRLGKHRIVDTLSLMQHAGTDNAFTKAYLDDSTRSIVNNLGAGQNSLEVISNRMAAQKGKGIEGFSNGLAAHTAAFDAEVLFRSFLNQKVGNQNIVDAALEAGRRANENPITGLLQGGQKQLFRAVGGVGNRDIENMLGFRVDPFNDMIYTTDGYRINLNRSGKNKNLTQKQRVRKEDLGDWVLKKGMTYTIDDIKTLEAVTQNNTLKDLTGIGDYVERMKKIHPGLAVRDLVAVKYTPVTEYNRQKALGEQLASLSNKNSMSSYIVAPKQDILSFFNQNLMMFAEKNEQGHYEIKKGAASRLEQVEFVEGEGDLTPVRQSGGNLIKRTIENGARQNIDDTASRKIREMGYSQFKGYMALSDAVEAKAAKLKGSDPQQNRIIALGEMMKNAKDTAKKIARGGDLNEGSLDAIHKILGMDWKNYEVNPRALDNAISLLDFTREISKDVLKPIMNEVDKLQDASKAEKQYVFGQAMDRAFYQLEQLNQGRKINQQSANVYATDLNYYEFDYNKRSRRGTPLGRLVGADETDTLRVSLNSNGAADLVRKIGGTLSNPSDKELTKRIAMLAESEGVINELAGGKDVSEYLRNNKAYIIATDLVGALRKKREVNPRAGFLTNPQTQTVTGANDVKAILGNPEFDRKNFMKEITETIKTHKPGTFFNLAQITGNGKENELTKLANSIVSDFMMDSLNEQDLRNMGHDNKSVKWMMNTRQVREKDYQRLVTEVLRGAGAMDMTLRLDKGSNIIALQRGSQVVDLSDLPRERITDNIAYTQVGRDRLAVGANLVTKGGKTGLVSDVGMAMDNIPWRLDHAVIAAQRRGGDPMRTFMGYISNLAKDLREGSSVQMLDEQDSKSGMHFNIRQYINRLGDVNGIDTISFGDSVTAREERKYFLSRVTNPNFDFDKADDAFKSIMAKHEKKILSYAFNLEGVGDDTNWILEYMSNRQKNSLSSDGTIKALSSQHEMELFNNPMRNFESSARYLGFRESKATKALEDLGISDHAFLGANLRTEVGQKRASSKRQGLEEIIHTEAIVKRAYVGSEAIKKKIYEAAENDPSKKDISDRLRTTANIYEGSAVASSRLGDAILQSYDHQRVSAQRKLFTEHSYSLQSIMEMQDMSSVVPEFKVGPDGKIHFEYKKGKYVQRGDTLLTEVAYGDKPNPIASKYDGALRFGWRSKSLQQLATEEEVTKNVYEYAKNSGINIADNAAFVQVANQLYDSEFYVDRLNKTTYRKVHEGRAEKGMTQFLYSGVGDSGDARTIKLLKETGLEGLKGRVLEKEFFDDLTEGRIEGGILSQMSTKNLSNSDFASAIVKAGFKDKEEMRNVLMSERHELSDFLSKQYDGALYFSQTWDEKHGNVSRPISLAIDEMFATSYKRHLGNDKNLSKAQAEALAAKEVHGLMKDTFVGTGEKGLGIINNRVVNPQMGYLDESHIKKNEFVNRYNEFMNDKDAFGKLMSNNNVGHTAIAVVQDFTGQTGAGDAKYGLTDAEHSLLKGFKISDREMNWMAANKMRNDTVSHAEKTLSKALSPEAFNEVFGFMVNKNEEGKSVLKEEFDGRSMFDHFMTKIEKDMYAQNGDNNLIIDQHGNKVAPSEVVEKYGKVAEGLHSVYGGAVSTRAAETAYSVAANMQAIKFNADGAVSLKELTEGEFGFQVKKLSDIDFTSGQDADFFKAGYSNDLYRQNTVVDLSEIDSKLLNDAGIRSGKLAIGEMGFQSIGTEVLQQSPHQVLKEVQDMHERLESMKSSGIATEQEIRSTESIMVNRLASFKGELEAVTTGKESALRRDLSEIRLEKSATAKAALMTLEDMEYGDISALRNAKVDGRSLIDLHKSDVLMDFRLVSEDHVRTMGLLDKAYLDDVGMTESQMIGRLKEGVQILGHRNPTIYEGSLSPMMMVLSDSIKDNKVVDYAPGAMAKKADADGDQIKSVLMSAKDSQGNNVDYIQYQKMLAEEAKGGAAVDGTLKEAFGMYRAQMYRNAIDVNHYYRHEMQKDLADIEKLDNEVADRIVSSRSVFEDKVRPELTHLANEELREKYYNDYRVVESRAIELSQKDNAGLRDLEGEQLRHAFLSQKESNKYISSAMKELDEDAYKYYGEAVDYYMRDMSFLASRVGANKQAAAGQINLPLYKVRKIRNIAGEGLIQDSQQARFLDNLLEAAEEAFLTPKHNEAVIVDNTMAIKGFNDSFNALARGEGTSGMVDWFEKNMPGRFKPERAYRNVDGSVIDTGNRTSREMYQEGANLLEDIFLGSKNIDRLNLSISSLAQIRRGVRGDKLQEALVYTEDNRSLLNNTIKGLGEGSSSLGVRKLDMLGYNSVLDSGEKQALLEAEWQSPEAPDAKENLKSLFSDAHGKMKAMNIQGKHLAFGALGMAGATMMLGYVGGNPSEKSSTVAAAGLQQDAYDIPVLTDDPAAVMQSNPGQGYVININASSPKGAEHAQGVIQQAMAGSYNSTNVNIAMNITNQSGNITESKIQSIIDGMLA